MTIFLAIPTWDGSPLGIYAFFVSCLLLCVVAMWRTVRGEVKYLRTENATLATKNATLRKEHVNDVKEFGTEAVSTIAAATNASSGMSAQLVEVSRDVKSVLSKIENGG